MKTYRRLVELGILAVAVTLAAGGCSKKSASETKTEAPRPEVKSEAPVTTAPAVKAQAQTAPKPVAAKPKAAPEPEVPPEPVPEVLFSVQGLEAGQVTNDRPLFVSVRVESSVEKEAALTLAPASGRWSDGVSVELVAVGAPENVLLRAKRVEASDGDAAATLGTGQAAEGLWLFSSGEVATLSPGAYRVRVLLAVADGDGWRGKAAGEAVDVTLVAAGGNATPRQQTAQVLALANEAMLAKDWAKAAQVLDGRLTTEPDDVELLKARALLCLQGDNIVAAHACVSRAWARGEREKWTHPPVDLYAISQAVMAAMAKVPEPAAKTALPTWSFPSAAVMTPAPKVAPGVGAK